MTHTRPTPEPATMAALLAERGFVPCWCGAARKRTAGPWGCGRRGCSDLERGTPLVTSKRPVAKDAPSKPRAGKAAEDALAEALSGAGYVVRSWREWLNAVEEGVAGDASIVREYRWGQRLDPERRFRSDFALPLSRLLIEVEGGAHGVQRQRKHDVLRDQLAQQAGYRILRVLPEQVNNGEALALVRRAVGGD